MAVEPWIELEDLLEPYRIAFEASPVGMAFVTPDWRFVECNPALCEMLGRTEEELKRHSATEFTHPEDQHLHEPGQQALLRGEIDSYQLEARYVHREGHAGWVSVHVGVVRDRAGALTLAICLIEDITETKWMREIHDRLLGLVLVGQGAQGLAQALADQISSPVALLDGYGQVLAEADHGGRRLAVPSRDELAGAGDGVSPPGRTIHPLRLGERVEGYLVAEDPPGAGQLTARAIDQAASSFALQLAMTRNAEEVEHRLHGDLFDALLSEDPPGSEALVRWGRRLGHDIFAFTHVAVVRPVDPGAATESAMLTRLARTAAAVAHETAPGSLAAPRVDSVVLALAAEDAAAARAAAQRIVERSLTVAGTRVVAGLSGAVTAPADLADALRDARHAADAAIALPRLGPVAMHGELDLHHLLLGRRTRDDVARAAGLTLAPLLQARSGDTLAVTLGVYLESLGALEATARRLGIHVNTLRQRLRRIEELLEVDLQSARTRMTLQLALEVLELDRG